jgi:hypothetical protein
MRRVLSAERAEDLRDAVLQRFATYDNGGRTGTSSNNKTSELRAGLQPHGGKENRSSGHTALLPSDNLVDPSQSQLQPSNAVAIGPNNVTDKGRTGNKYIPPGARQAYSSLDKRATRLVTSSPVPVNLPVAPQPTTARSMYNSALLKMSGLAHKPIPASWLYKGERLHGEFFYKGVNKYPQGSIDNNHQIMKEPNGQPHRIIPDNFVAAVGSEADIEGLWSVANSMGKVMYDHSFLIVGMGAVFFLVCKRLKTSPYAYESIYSKPQDIIDMTVAVLAPACFLVYTKKRVLSILLSFNSIARLFLQFINGVHLLKEGGKKISAKFLSRFTNKMASVAPQGNREMFYFEFDPQNSNPSYSLGVWRTMDEWQRVYDDLSVVLDTHRIRALKEYLDTLAVTMAMSKTKDPSKYNASAMVFSWGGVRERTDHNDVNRLSQTVIDRVSSDVLPIVLGKEDDDDDDSENRETINNVLNQAKFSDDYRVVLATLVAIGLATACAIKTYKHYKREQKLEAVSVISDFVLPEITSEVREFDAEVKNTLESVIELIPDIPYRYPINQKEVARLAFKKCGKFRRNPPRDHLYDNIILNYQFDSYQKILDDAKFSTNINAAVKLLYNKVKAKFDQLLHGNPTPKVEFEGLVFSCDKVTTTCYINGVEASKETAQEVLGPRPQSFYDNLITIDRLNEAEAISSPPVPVVTYPTNSVSYTKESSIVPGLEDDRKEPSDVEDAESWTTCVYEGKNRQQRQVKGSRRKQRRNWIQYDKGMSVDDAEHLARDLAERRYEQWLLAHQDATAQERNYERESIVDDADIFFEELKKENSQGAGHIRGDFLSRYGLGDLMGFTRNFYEKHSSNEIFDQQMHGDDRGTFEGLSKNLKARRSLLEGMHLAKVAKIPSPTGKQTKPKVTRISCDICGWYVKPENKERHVCQTCFTCNKQLLSFGPGKEIKVLTSHTCDGKVTRRNGQVVKTEGKKEKVELESLIPSNPPCTLPKSNNLLVLSDSNGNNLGHLTYINGYGVCPSHILKDTNQNWLTGDLYIHNDDSHVKVTIQDFIEAPKEFKGKATSKRDGICYINRTKLPIFAGYQQCSELPNGPIMIYHYDLIKNNTLRPKDMNPVTSRGTIVDKNNLCYSVSSNHGVCGSPSFDQRGKVFGMHVSKYNDGSSNQFEDVSHTSAISEYLRSKQAKNLPGILISQSQ